MVESYSVSSTLKVKDDLSPALERAAKLATEMGQAISDINTGAGNLGKFAGAIERAAMAMGMWGEASKDAQAVSDKLVKAADALSGSHHAMGSLPQSEFGRYETLMDGAAKSMGAFNAEAKAAVGDMRSLGPAVRRWSKIAANIERAAKALGDFNTKAKDLPPAMLAMDQAAKTSFELAENLKQAASAMKSMGRDLPSRVARREDRADAGDLMFGGQIMSDAGKMLMNLPKAAFEADKVYTQAFSRFKEMNLGDDVNRQANEFAMNTNVVGASPADLMTQLRNLTSFMGSFDLARQVAPMFAQLEYANKALYGDEKGMKFDDAQIRDMEKIIELRGGYKTPDEFRRLAELIEKVYVGSGGLVKPSDLLLMAKREGVSGRLLADDDFVKLGAVLSQEMGSSQFGTGLQSAFNNLAMGHTSTRAAQELMKLGLLDPSKVEYDKIGRVKAIQPGAIQGFDELVKDPMGWMHDKLVPAMVSAGKTTMSQQLEEIAYILTNRTGASLYSLMDMQYGNVQKHFGIYDKSFGISDTVKNAEATPQGSKDAFTAALNRLLTVLSQNAGLIGLYTTVLTQLADGLTVLGNWFQKNPEMGKQLILWVGGFGVAMFALGKVLSGIGTIGMLTMMTRSIPALATMFTALAAPGLASAVTAITTLLGAIYLFSHWEGLKQEIGDRAGRAVDNWLHPNGEDPGPQGGDQTKPYHSLDYVNGLDMMIRAFREGLQGTEVKMDGKVVGQIVTKGQEKQMTQPPTSTNSADFYGSPNYATSYGNILPPF